MKNRVAGRIAAISSLAVVMCLGAAPAHAGEKIANSYICVFKKDAVGKADVEGKANAAARAHGGAVSHVYRNSIRGFSANISEQGMTNMRRNNPNIAYCEQDQVMSIVATIKGKPGGGGGGSTGEQIPPGITAVNGGVDWSNKTNVAWIIDTGIDSTHPDLNVDASRGAYFTGRSVEDENGHGTHVSGTIAAIKGNGMGVVGVAAGATVIPVRVLDRRGSGSNSGVIAGVDFVGANGHDGDVANMSLGGGVSTALDDAVVNASNTSKVKFALAAGNENDNANNHSPARANGPYVYTVSAVDGSKKMASFSNYGNPPIDYAEPGVNILSTWDGGGYNTISGTSMATPHLAGILLLGAVRSGGAISGDKDSSPDTFGVH